MRRQPPIVRCFVSLCFGTAVTLTAFEWHNPFPAPVITPATAPHLTSDTVLNFDNTRPREQPVARLARWLPFGQVQPSEAHTQAANVELVLSLQSRLLEVRVPGKAPVRYEVAVGQDDWQTPVGKFKVINKLENPAWQHPITKETIAPGPDNPLGTRWIGFWSDGQAQIGFHGTNQEDLIGEAVSHGCVRMRNKDIQTLYQQVDIGTTVKIMP